MDIGAYTCVELLLGGAFDEQLTVDVFGGERCAGAETLCGELGAFDICAQARWEIDVIVDAGGVVQPQVAIHNGLNGLQAVGAGGTEHILAIQFGAIELG